MSWVQFAINHNLKTELEDCERALRDARAELKKARKKARDLDYWDDQARTHLAGERALRKRAMEELDKASGGPEHNPLRKQAYEDPDTLRIPSGEREGDVATLADHIFFEAFVDRYSRQNLKSKWKIGYWTDFVSWKLFG